MLCARDEQIPQTNIEPIYYSCNMVQHLKHFVKLYGTQTKESNTKQGNTKHVSIYTITKIQG